LGTTGALSSIRSAVGVHSHYALVHLASPLPSGSFRASSSLPSYVFSPGPLDCRVPLRRPALRVQPVEHLRGRKASRPATSHGCTLAVTVMHSRLPRLLARYRHALHHARPAEGETEQPPCMAARLACCSVSPQSVSHSAQLRVLRLAESRQTEPLERAVTCWCSVWLSASEPLRSSEPFSLRTPFRSSLVVPQQRAVAASRQWNRERLVGGCEQRSCAAGNSHSVKEPLLLMPCALTLALTLTCRALLT
jgi:hypothetical protein